MVGARIEKKTMVIRPISKYRAPPLGVTKPLKVVFSASPTILSQAFRVFFSGPILFRFV